MNKLSMERCIKVCMAFCAFLTVACQKQQGDIDNDPTTTGENKEQPSDDNPFIWDTTIPTADTLFLVDCFPELLNSSSVTKDPEYGLCLRSGKQDWDFQLSLEAPFFPEQSYDYYASAIPIEGKRHPWRIRTGETVVWKDLHYQKEIQFFSYGECGKPVVTVHIALDPSSHCSKALLSDVELTAYPSMGHSTVLYESGMLEVDHEGVDLTLPISSYSSYLNDPDRFVNEDGQMCLSRIVSFKAEVDVPEEDKTEELLAETLDFNISVHFDKAVFSQIIASLQPDLTPNDLLPGASIEMPDFFTTQNHELTFVNPIMHLAYTCDDSVNEVIWLNSKLFLENNPYEKTFYEAGDYWLGPALTMSYYHSNLKNPVLNDYFQTPFPKEYFFPSLSVQLNTANDLLLSAKTYSFHVETEWFLPLCFNGTFHGETYQTSTLYLNSEELEAPTNKVISMGRHFASGLPFSCFVTPVFQEDGSEPIYLETFRVHDFYSFSYDYTPSSDPWKASLYFLITPAYGSAVPFKRDAFLRASSTWMAVRK